MKKSININFNKDDVTVNDYLYCWTELDERPNKTSILHAFNNQDFEKVLSNYNSSIVTVFTEIFPTETYHLENQKFLVKLNDGLYISYTVFDARSEESFTGDVSVLFKTEDNEKSIKLISLLESLLDESKKEISENNDSLFTLVLDQNGYDLLPINYLEADYENLDLYFNNDVLKKTKKLSKKIDSEKKGISVIYGEKGTGKSTLCCALLQNIEKKKVFIPSSLVDVVIGNMEFRNFLIRNKNLVLIFDDCESNTSDFYLKSNSFVKNLTQLVDSLDSDNYLLNIVLIFNTESYEEIDENILDSNFLIDTIEVGYLSQDKCKDLGKFLGKSKNYKCDHRLVDVIKKKNKSNPKLTIGYE